MFFFFFVVDVCYTVCFFGVMRKMQVNEWLVRLYVIFVRDKLRVVNGYIIG